MPFNSVRACPEDSKKLPLRGKTSPAPGQILPGRGEMSPQVTKRGTDVTAGDKRGVLLCLPPDSEKLPLSGELARRKP